jgi:hypothetical protein
MLKVHLKCPKHPRYDPSRQFEAGIVGGCPVCQHLFDIWRETLALERLIRAQKEKHEQITNRA